VDLTTIPIQLDEGVAVAGQVTAADGTPVAGAKLSLRSGALPSTVGSTNATGAFSLRARPGTFGATVTVGDSSPGAELSVAAAPGISLADVPTTVSFRLAQRPAARIGLTVTGAGADAKVVFEALAPVADAAMVEIAAAGATTVRSATMRVRAEMTIGANGTVQTGPLPRARYRATVFAANAAPMMATVATLSEIDATLGDVNATVAMTPPVPITGSLGPGTSARESRVSAIDDDAPLALAPDAVAPFRTQADASGGFLLNVNPSRRYRLVIDPPSASSFARMMLPAVEVSAAPVAVTTATLPAALLYAGRVLDPFLQPVGETLVSAYCIAASAGCVDAERPVAEALTTTDGGFRLALPDPGVGP
jgi:hypothetical protein